MNDSWPVVEDGWGNQWPVCGHNECDLEIVRPGKVQCSGHCNDLCGWLPEEEHLR